MSNGKLDIPILTEEEAKKIVRDLTGMDLILVGSASMRNPGYQVLVCDYTKLPGRVRFAVAVYAGFIASVLVARFNIV